MATFEWARTAEQVDAATQATEPSLGEVTKHELNLNDVTRPGDLKSGADLAAASFNQHPVSGEDWEMEEQLNEFTKVAETEAYDAIRGMRNIPSVLGASVLAMAAER
ncbi:MAG TPA: hypothetical protein VK978_03035 [Candidatus Saccharimonadales bacterium]|nr:hypothetical protein [Candidatus Saccharimonadales bacterium]